MDSYLYGRHTNHGNNKRRPIQENNKSFTMTQGQGFVLEARKMQIRSNGTRISGTDHLRGTNSNGRRKIDWYQGVARPTNR